MTIQIVIFNFFLAGIKLHYKRMRVLNLFAARLNDNSNCHFLIFYRSSNQHKI